jgi:molybdate transport system ATP-binding protein
MSADTTLTVELRVARGDFRLDVAFAVPAGVTILLGRSGAGKSTTLDAISGLVRPLGGRVALGDEVWFDAELRVDRPVERRRVAYVLQSLALFPHLSARANVEYGVDRALPSAARRARAEEMLARMKVGHLSARRPPTFSGGEAQRVALARAFAMAPRLMLLDEPFSAMDADLRRELAADLRATIAVAGIPVIHVTHQPDEARAMGDRVIHLEAGRVTAPSSPVP